MTRAPSPPAACAAVVSPPPPCALPPLRGNNVALARVAAELLAPSAVVAFAVDGRRVPIAAALARARREREAAQRRLDDAREQIAEAARAGSRPAPGAIEKKASPLSI
jgi:hypothetical protein